MRSRQAQREQTVELAITIYGDGTFSSGTVRALVGGGLFLETVQFLDVDDPVHFDMRLPSGRKTIHGKVAWVRDIRGYDRYPPGMAISLLEADPEVRAAIDAVLRKSE
jgi:Tfp pilus assembly protein PilZ